VSPAEWGDDAPQQPAPASAAAGWPATLKGYAKTLAALLAGVPAAVVVTWLQSAGIAHLPSWATAVIPLVLSVLAVLFGPKNKA
jgi:hypothetical protein